MIKSITITNYLGQSITLDMRSPDKSGLYIKKIEGLGPPNATINAKEIATFDGGLYNSARASTRNIVLTLGFLPNPSIEDMRQLTYKYFPIKKKLRFLIETDNRIAETYGYVESNEPDIFSQNETTEISIICPDPYFYSAGDEGKNVTVFSGVESSFEFPFSNESTTEALLEAGQVRSLSEQLIIYTGESEVGMLMTIHAVGKVGSITIHSILTGETMTIDNTKIETITGSGIVNGDDIYISTVKGDKYIQLVRDGVTTNILNAMDKNSTWFQLSKGDNIFAYTTDQGADNLQFKIENQVIYEGV